MRDMDDKKQKKREYEKERYAWLKAHHVCVCCAQEAAYKTGVLCRACRARQNASNAEYKRRHPKTQEEIRKQNGKILDLRQQRKDSRCCPMCGRPVGDGHVHCAHCRARMRQYYQNHRKQKHDRISREIGMELGLCCWCLREQALPGRKLCAACYDKAVKSIEHARQFVKGGFRSGGFYFGKYDRGER